jgi:hypothetical protein
MNLVEIKKDLVTMSVKEFVTSKAFVSLVPVVRVNENGYPFITFIDKDNKAENVYFSREASKAVDAGVPVDKAMLSTYQIGITHNAQGEERIKLISNSNRVDIASLLD